MCYLPMSFFSLKCQGSLSQLKETSEELIGNMTNILINNGALYLQESEETITVRVENTPYILAPCRDITKNKKVVVDTEKLYKSIPQLKDYFGTYVMRYINDNSREINAFLVAEKQFDHFIKNIHDFRTVIHGVLDELFTERTFKRKISTTFQGSRIYFYNFGIVNERLCSSDNLELFAYMNNVMREFITDVGARDNNLLLAINGGNKVYMYNQ